MTSKQNKELEKIAEKVAGIETLETRKSDSLDFYDMSVWTIKELMQKAYDAGVNDVKKNKQFACKVR